MVLVLLKGVVRTLEQDDYQLRMAKEKEEDRIRNSNAELRTAWSLTALK